ncbi:hypothetical protein CCACVL1_18628 [Corchorus capsularis]|uniref:Uncharacterized protein n=1 Tax=Corchorus capsularis TaxID=210143 RepID=A0A1R3HKD6_COCAP|nr:hypothetical protein CCACVL1_18628 [Corchorus capsularis]
MGRTGSRSKSKAPAYGLRQSRHNGLGKFNLGHLTNFPSHL